MVKKELTDFQARKKKARKVLGKKPKKGFLGNRKLFLFLGASVGLGLSVGMVLFVLYKWLAVSTFFQITSIQIEGNRRLDKRQVLNLSGVDIRTNLLTMDGDDVQEKIKDHDWVRTVSLKRNWPSDLVLTIQEREPVAMVNTKEGFKFVDKLGVVFALAHPADDLDFPIITGLEDKFAALDDIEQSDGLSTEDAIKKALLFIRYSGDGSSSLPRQNISEIHVGEDGAYTLFLADQPFPIFLGEKLSRKRYYRLAKVLYWLYKKREFSNVNFIRMDYMNNKVLVGKKEEKS